MSWGSYPQIKSDEIDQVPDEAQIFFVLSSYKGLKGKFVSIIEAINEDEAVQTLIEVEKKVENPICFSKARINFAKRILFTEQCDFPLDVTKGKWIRRNPMNISSFLDYTLMEYNSLLSPSEKRTMKKIKNKIFHSM